MKHETAFLLLLGKNIRKKRDEKSISQQELADYANIAKSTIQRIEKGNFNASVAILLKISSALECEITDLLPKSE